jgi:transposase
MILKVRSLTEEEEATIEKQVHARALPVWKVTRAKIIWYAWQGENVPEIARRLQLCEKTTRMWLKRFNELEEFPRSGRPPIYPREQVAVVIQTALIKPEELDQPFACWTLDRLETYINEVKGIAIKRSRISEIFLAQGLGWRHEET